MRPVVQQVSMRKTDLHSGYYVNATPKSCRLSKQFTELSDTITALDVDRDGKVVIVGDINGEINGYLTDDSLFGKRQAARIFRFSSSSYFHFCRGLALYMGVLITDSD